MKDNMIIPATEFKSNFGYYLKLVEKEDVFITKNGKTVTNKQSPDKCSRQTKRDP